MGLLSRMHLVGLHSISKVGQETYVQSACLQTVSVASASCLCPSHTNCSSGNPICCLPPPADLTFVSQNWPQAFCWVASFAFLALTCLAKSANDILCDLTQALWGSVGAGEVTWRSLASLWMSRTKSSSWHQSVRGLCLSMLMYHLSSNFKN